MIFNSYASGRESLAGVHLVSCGHIFAKPGREILRPKGREDYLLFFVARGEETFYLDAPQTAGAGSFVLFAPGEKQHHAYLGEGTAEFYYIHFRCEGLPDGIEMESSRIYPTSFSGASQIFEEILAETLEKKPHYEALCLAKLFSLFAMIARECTHAGASSGAEHRRIARAIQFIGKNFEKNLSLEDYAALCLMSKYHFLRIFKAVTGQSPMEYRMRIRIENAKELIDLGELSFAEIGERLGFSSAAHFSDAFKKQTGLSPRNYLKSKQFIT